MISKAKQAAQETGRSFESCLSFIKSMEEDWDKDSSYQGLDKVCIQNARDPGLMKRLKEVEIMVREKGLVGLTFR
jgi:hypothetical protein